MLVSFMQNSNVKMTKAMYYEMCEALGNEPTESEIPVELDDFPLEIQEILELYKFLKDEWETMNGVYLGKNFTGIKEVFDIFEIDIRDRKFYMSMLYIVDSIRSKEIKKHQATTK